MRIHLQALLIAVFLGTTGLNAQAWDHPGHMTTAAIAFAEMRMESSIQRGMSWMVAVLHTIFGLFADWARIDLPVEI